jgi:hypothetical protein
MPQQDYSRYELLPGLLLGFHGTDQKIVENLLSGKEPHLKPSKNDYDWLGHGIYFWEYSPARAIEFAQHGANGGRSTRGKIKAPAVIGAIIDPKRCLNLLEASALDQLREAYNALEIFRDVGLMEEMPENKGGNDLLRRHLDCAVIETLHGMRQSKEQPAYDTVRSAFWEGAPLYPNAGFKEKNHVQICVRNTDCIIGYFRPIP